MARTSDPVADGPAMNALIHKAVRRDLDAFDAALGAYPDGDHERAEALGVRFRWLDRLLDHHHEGEEDHLWPVLRTGAARTELVAELSEEHERMVSALGAASDAIGRLSASASAADARAARESLAVLRRSVDDHFEHEERVVADLCSNADARALRNAVRKLGRGVSFREGLWFLQWVSDDTTPDEANFLGRLIPRPVRWLSGRFAADDYTRTSAVLHG